LEIAIAFRAIKSPLPPLFQVSEFARLRRGDLMLPPLKKGDRGGFAIEVGWISDSASTIFGYWGAGGRARNQVLQSSIGLFYFCLTAWLTVNIIH